MAELSPHVSVLTLKTKYNSLCSQQLNEHADLIYDCVIVCLFMDTVVLWFLKLLLAMKNWPMKGQSSQLENPQSQFNLVLFYYLSFMLFYCIIHFSWFLHQLGFFLTSFISQCTLAVMFCVHVYSSSCSETAGRCEHHKSVSCVNVHLCAL